MAAAIRKRGLSVAHPAWDDLSTDWSLFRIAVIRSTWDYHTRRSEFLRWVRRASVHVDLWNRPATLRWNTDKAYLRELEARGVPTVPTVWVDRGARVEVRALARERGWTSFVVKPAVSAAGANTYRFSLRRATAAQRHLDRLAGSGAVLVQPYMESVATKGERSLVFLDGRFSHAVRRVPLFPRPTHRPSEALAPAPRPLRELGRRALAHSPEAVLYARVDLVQDGGDRWRLLELEVTEPSLFFVPFPRAAATLASAIGRRLSR